MSIEQYAVIGHPIAHSKSPLIHQAFAKQFNKAIRYEAVLSPLDGFAATLHRLQREGYVGVNVTVPFKFEAYGLSQALSERAKAAGAVNTLSFHSAEASCQIQGDNTDGSGLVNDILRHFPTALASKNILLLGAGGAAQGVILPLLAQRPAQLTIANRSLNKAQAMLEKFAPASAIYGVPIAVNAYADCTTAFDVVINATSAGLTDTPLPLSPHLFTQHTLAYDMMYGRETPFMFQARMAGAQVLDGLGMLVEQAAEAFYIWHGVRPDTAAVMQALR